MKGHGAEFGHKIEEAVARPVGLFDQVIEILALM
jgi:hypothetical protein